ncbi:MAG: long-chain fatty acid--CoA ligase [Deltaproteobacteria bacterium]|jgi:fatty-acyl-CoA synthase|nr:long-chain fatty acid--CoA ligase [Deltaproteobacteria bacterium]
MSFSTMMDRPLLISDLFEHGRRLYQDSRVITVGEGGDRIATYAEVGDRTDKLAKALGRLGVRREDRVGTFCWNTQEHLEAYFAISSMGAVMHTLNIRLFPEQLAFVINHAQDKVIIVDDSLIPLLAKVAAELKSVEHIIVVGEGGDDAMLRDAPRATLHRYDALLAAETPGIEWPVLDERAPAAMAYTSGTTGDPKGVVYSHRSTVLHSYGITSGAVTGLNERDMILTIVPMFHANCWGLPYAGWWVGTDFLQPARFLQPEPLVAMIERHRPTFAGAVPSIWTAVLNYGEGEDIDLSSFRLVICGGSAVPKSLMQAFEEKYGVTILQLWGMTETSPLGSIASVPPGVEGQEAWTYRVRTGRPVAGIELRIVDDSGQPLPWDGESVGEIEARGPWVTGRYYGVDASEKFHDGWLRTGDVGFIDARGYVQITDRSKDVIKSGGEWISSVELENEIIAHPEVAEAAVIGIPDDKWDERPLACVVRKSGSKVTPEALRTYLEDKVAKWWLPERWTFIDEIPKTSVGKFDKKVLRTLHERGELPIE